MVTKLLGNLVTNETIGYSGARVYNKHVEAVETTILVRLLLQMGHSMTMPLLQPKLKITSSDS